MPYTLNQQILGFVLIDIYYSMDLRRFDFCSLTWIQDYRFIRILSFNLDNSIQADKKITHNGMMMPIC